MWQEFKTFALRGNVMDMAIGIILGTAFAKITSSLVSDVIMPPIGLVLGEVDFSSLYINLSDQTYVSLAEAQQAGAPTINYGRFLTTVFDFVLVAAILFLVIQTLNRMRQDPEPPSPTTRKCPYCVSTIPLQALRCPECTSELSDVGG